MNRKQLIGLGILVTGIFFILLARHWMKQIAQAKGFVDHLSDFFTHNTAWNPLIEFFGGTAQQEVSKYDTQVIAFFYAGLILGLSGMAMIVLCRKKRL